MSKLTNLFEDYRQYQSKKVDSPYYEPLWQPILEQTPTKEEVRKVKQRGYMKKYYEKNKEKMKEYQREYYRKHSNKLPKKHGLKGVQLSVYNYMIEQYQLWDRVPRGTQIAKALNIGEQTVYNAVFSLVKKGLVGRGQAGKYYLIHPPIKEEDEVKKELEVMGETFDEPEMVYVEENKYDEMEKKIKSLEEQISNSVGHIEGLINSNTELEKKNMGLLHQIEELKLLIKLLYYLPMEMTKKEEKKSELEEKLEYAKNRYNEACEKADYRVEEEDKRYKEMDKLYTKLSKYED